MCSVVILFDPLADWPVLLAGNRDERLDRAWTEPGAHWPEQPDVVGGRDSLAGGSWFAINTHGVLATVLNREGSLGPAAGKRSRGELPLLALDHADALAAADALSHLDPRAYRPFNLLLADNRDAFWLRHAGDGQVTVAPVPAGLSMLTSQDLNDAGQARIRHYRQRFAEVARPDPTAHLWSSWQHLLADRVNPLDSSPQAGLCLAPPLDDPDGFATSSSCLLALPSIARMAAGVRPQWLFCTGRPDQGVWRNVRV